MGRPRVRLGVGLLAVFALAAAALYVLHHPQRLAVAPRTAIAAVRHDPAAAKYLRHGHNEVSVMPEDSRVVRVTFSDGPRVELEAGVGRHGMIPSLLVSFERGWQPYGDWIAYEPAVLIGLALLFVLSSAVLPLRHVRNLDVLALLSLLVPVLLFVERWFQWSTVAAVPGLLYLGGRAAWLGLAEDPVQAPCLPLYAWLTRRLPAGSQIRLLRMTLLALAFAFVAVGVSSPDAVDVIYAVMEGATRIVHGVLPYGHVAVFHGDTYPPLSYLFYAPLAALSPVHSGWDPVDLGLAAAVAVTLAAAGLLWAAGRRRAGLLAAIRWLSFPPLLIVVSTGTTDVWVPLLLLAAILTARRPGWSSGVLAVAAWFKLAPFALVPLWLAPLRGRRLVAALAALAGVSAVTLGAVVALGHGLSALHVMARALSFQFDRGPFQSVWGTLGIEALQPLAQAAALTLVVAAVLRLNRRPDLFQQPARLASLCAAVLIALQLSADYWAFLYPAWFVPLLVLRGEVEREDAELEQTSGTQTAIGAAVQDAVRADRYVYR